MFCPDFTENAERPSLSAAKVGDYVFVRSFNTFGKAGMKYSYHLSKIGHIDSKGRLYICAATAFHEWRHGFNPETGTAFSYKGQSIFALTEAEKQQGIEREQRYKENVRRAAEFEASEHGQLLARVQHLFSGGYSIREMSERIDVEPMRQIVRILDDNWKA